MEIYQIKEKIEELINSDLLESGCSEYTAKDYKKALSEFLIKYKSLEARVGIMSWYEDTWYGNLKEKYISKKIIKDKIQELVEKYEDLEFHCEREEILNIIEEQIYILEEVLRESEREKETE